MEPIRLQGNRNSLPALKFLNPLPDDVQRLIFFQLNEHDIAKASKVSKLWNAEISNAKTLQIVKNFRFSDLKSFVNWITPHVGDNYQKSLKRIYIGTKILQSANLWDVKNSIDDLQRNIIDVLKNLRHDQLEELKIIYKKNELSPFEEIFELTQWYREIELSYLNDYSYEDVKNFMPLLRLEDFEIKIDLRFRTENFGVTRQRVFSLLVSKILSDKNNFNKLLDIIISDEIISDNFREDLFNKLLDCNMNTCQINQMIETTIAILRIPIYMDFDLTQVFAMVCKIAETTPDFLSTYPNFKTLYRKLIVDQKYSSGAKNIAKLHPSIILKLEKALKSEELKIQPPKKKDNCIIM